MVKFSASKHINMLDMQKWKSSIFFGAFILSIDFFLTMNQVWIIISSFEREKTPTLVPVDGLLGVLWHELILTASIILFSYLFTAALQVQKTAWFYILFFLFIVFRVTVQQPQILSNTGFNQLLPLDRSAFNEAIVAIVCVALALAVIFRSWRSLVIQKARIQRLCNIGLTVLTLLLLFINWKSVVEMPEADPRTVEYSSSNKKPNIIVISIDAMNQDLDEVFQKYGNANFKKFLDKSTKIESAIADIPQTHGSFISLFSGLRPYKHIGRYPFNQVAGHQDQNIFKTLKELKDKGYQVTVMRDEMITAPSFVGSAIDQVLLPKGHEVNQRFGLLYFSILAYGIFDNVVGHFLFPAAYSNSSYLFGNRPFTTARRAIDHLSNLKALDKPEFFFFHTCALHFPLNLSYPYYPKSVYDDGKESRFSYPSNFVGRTYADRALVQSGADYNRQIYQNGSQMVVEQILNPIFEFLDKSKLMENSMVFLISDHGENLWDLNRYVIANAALPFHGDTFLFGSQSEYAYFRVLNAQQSTPETAAEINLSQQFRKSLGLSYSISPVYSETAYSPYRQGPDISQILTPVMIRRSLKRDEENGFSFADNEILQPAVLQKQRAVYLDGFKLVSYLTTTGRMFFLCNTRKDPLCENNLIDSQDASSIRNTLVAELKKIYLEDVKNDLDVEITSIHPTIHSVKSYLASKNYWIHFVGANTLFSYFHDFDNALSEYKNIFYQTTSPDLKLLISQTMNLLCVPFRPEDTQFLNDASSYLEEMINFPFQNANRIDELYCLKVRYDQAARSAANLYDQTWKYDSIETLDTQWNLPEASSYLKKLAEKYGISERKRISNIFQQIDQANKKREAVDFIKFIKQRYSSFFQYSLYQDRDPYYYLKFIVLNSIGKDPARDLLVDISAERASFDFETRLFNLLEDRFKLDPISSTTEIKDIRAIRIERLKKILNIAEK